MVDQIEVHFVVHTFLVVDSFFQNIFFELFVVVVVDIVVLYLDFLKQSLFDNFDLEYFDFDEPFVLPFLPFVEPFLLVVEQ